MSPATVQEEIQSITQQLIPSYQPKKIILFGSAASNQNRDIHDLDFLIIKDDVPPRGIDRMRQVRSIVRKRMAADFIVVTPQEIEERIRLEDPFVQNILRNGRILYG